MLSNLIINIKASSVGTVVFQFIFYFLHFYVQARHAGAGNFIESSYCTTITRSFIIIPSLEGGILYNTDDLA